MCHESPQIDSHNMLFSKASSGREVGQREQQKGMRTLTNGLFRLDRFRLPNRGRGDSPKWWHDQMSKLVVFLYSKCFSFFIILQPQPHDFPLTAIWWCETATKMRALLLKVNGWPNWKWNQSHTGIHSTTWRPNCLSVWLSIHMPTAGLTRIKIIIHMWKRSRRPSVDVSSHLNDNEGLQNSANQDKPEDPGWHSDGLNKHPLTCGELDLNNENPKVRRPSCSVLCSLRKWG